MNGYAQVKGPVLFMLDLIVFAAIDETIVAEIEKSIERGNPPGDDEWIVKTAVGVGLESTIRPRERLSK